MVARALAIGPPLGHHEARLAEAELAAARGADGHPAIAGAALARGGQAGYTVLVPRLRVLAT